MAIDENDARRRAWKNYWSSGLLHSCANTSGRNYAGAIGEFWRLRFSAMERGSRVLDLATGNGALPQLLHEVRGKECEIDAIDQAELAPGWSLPQEHAHIRFHPSVSIESLPFADATFDAVVSQFGFEYAHREKAIAESLRVAGANAVMALVMHHSASVLVQVGREELRHHEFLNAEHGLLHVASEILPWIARVRSGEFPTPAANALRQRYNNSLNDLAETASASVAPDLLLEARAMVHRLLARTGVDPAAALTDLREYTETLKHARLRTSEMIACALSEGEVEGIASTIRSQWHGKPIEVSVLSQPEGVLAWTLETSLKGGAQ